MGSVAKSYMRKDFIIYDEMRKYLTIYEEAVSHIWLCNWFLQNFLTYEDNLIFVFISVEYHTVVYMNQIHLSQKFFMLIFILLEFCQDIHRLFFTSSLWHWQRWVRFSGDNKTVELWHRWQIMGTISGCRHLKVNLKAKIYIHIC